MDAPSASTKCVLSQVTRGQPQMQAVASVMRRFEEQVRSRAKPQSNNPPQVSFTRWRNRRHFCVSGLLSYGSCQGF